LAQAEEGLLHVMGVLRERGEVREEFDLSTRLSGDRRNGGWDADRTSESRKSTEDLDGIFPFGMPSQGPTGGLAEA
jgi:hypothetical protein